ncbi:MAG: MBL fold metallo-hydrolase [Gammaproteobacteria bacterium]|nr:MAG: MBL fold metallo-hydrolase [Gammaproteobacteria bacterium]
MSTPLHEDLGQDTRLVDCRLYRPALAACYLVRDGDELALIDCGTRHSLPQILEAIAAMGGSPEQVRWIIPTHVHLDHAGGAGVLMQHCPHATLVTHPRGVPHMIDPSRLQAGATAVYGEAAFARDFGQLEPISEERCIAAEDGQAFALGGRELRFYHTPGHANHHGCILDSASGWLFTGDTFGLGYRELAIPSPYIVATTTPVAFDPEAWQHSLDRLLALEPSAVCLTHYGKYEDPSDLAPMLRNSIQAHVEIALAEESNNTEGREERLYETVKRLLVDGAMAHTGLPRERIAPLLDNDARLNAQGLAVWLARRAKRRQEQKSD